MEIYDILVSKASHKRAASEIASAGYSLLIYGWDEYVVIDNRLVLISYNMSGVSTDCYIESIHELSLIHDDEDLPSFNYRQVISDEIVKALRSLLSDSGSISLL